MKYKTTHTKEYYEKYKAVLFERYKKDCDYEHDLLILLPDFSLLPAEAREKVIKMYAEKVAETAKQKLIERMRMIQDIKAGRASLGYTTASQEVRARHDLNEGFEFSCYMLAEFKRKYNIE